MKNIITYTVNKNFNNELYLSVQNGEVVVKAPWYYTNNQIQDIIEEKKQWILNKINEYQLAEEKKYIRNEIVKLLGEDCKVRINYKNLKKPTLTVEGKNITICLPNKYKKLNRDEILVKLIEKLYDLVAKTEIEPIMEKVRKELGFAPEDYKVKRIDNKMADCDTDKGIIFINPDIVKYDKQTIEYILIHQFCHLKYKTHSKKFNEILNNYILDIRKYSRICDEIGF
jgi:predicted metal-dependent hydrolase